MRRRLRGRWKDGRRRVECLHGFMERRVRGRAAACDEDRRDEDTGKDDKLRQASHRYSLIRTLNPSTTSAPAKSVSTAIPGSRPARASVASEAERSNRLCTDAIALVRSRFRPPASGASLASLPTARLAALAKSPSASMAAIVRWTPA